MKSWMVKAVMFAVLAGYFVPQLPARNERKDAQKKLAAGEYVEAFLDILVWCRKKPHDREAQEELKTIFYAMAQHYRSLSDRNQPFLSGNRPETAGKSENRPGGSVPSLWEEPIRQEPLSVRTGLSDQDKQPEPDESLIAAPFPLGETLIALKRKMAGGDWLGAAGLCSLIEENSPGARLVAEDCTRVRLSLERLLSPKGGDSAARQQPRKGELALKSSGNPAEVLPLSDAEKILILQDRLKRLTVGESSGFKP